MMRATSCDAAEVIDILRGAVGPKTDKKGRYTVDNLIQQGQCFKLTDDAGQVLGAYLLSAFNSTLWVMLAAGQAQCDLTAALIELTTIQARQLGFDAIGFRTERRGLVKKAQRAGFEVIIDEGDAVQMRKYLQ